MLGGTSSATKYGLPGNWFKEAHDRIVAARTDEAKLLTIVSSAMRMDGDKFWKVYAGSNRRDIEEAIEVHPLTAILRPRLATRDNRNLSREKCLFERREVFADHDGAVPPNGSGAERRGTIAEPRSGPSAPNASARATG